MSSENKSTFGLLRLGLRFLAGCNCWKTSKLWGRCSRNTEPAGFWQRLCAD